MTIKRIGIIGDPVEHSISPAMQQPALDDLGLLVRYERWRTPLDELPARIESLRADDVLGANVTVPHKQAVIPLIDKISELALAAGAVNTIVNRNGRLFGDNTDVYGFQTSLEETVTDAATRNAVILGAGGASRAVVLARSNGQDRAASPCGGCRQLLWEFGHALQVVFRGADGELQCLPIDALLPAAFGLPR